MACILFVCAANICRSPSAQAVALNRLRSQPEGEQIVMVSAGTRAEGGAPWCQEARTLTSVDAATLAVMGRHQARRVSKGDIDEATMVVAADRQTSAEIVRIDPAVRSKLFTMREAAVLSSRVVDSVRLPANGVKNHAVEVRPLTRPAVPGGALHWLVGEMDAARGQVSLITERRRRRLFRSERVTVFDVDIRDAHVKSGHANHRHVLAEVTSVVTQTMDGVVYVLGLSVG